MELEMFFKTESYFTHINDLENMMDALNIFHSSKQCQLFMDVSSTTLKVFYIIVINFFSFWLCNKKNIVITIE